MHEAIAPRQESATPSTAIEAGTLTPARSLHILMTVNVAWNIWNFRRPLLTALLADGHTVTVLAPPDEFAARLEELGCRFVPLAMDQKGLNPLSDVALALRMRQSLARLRPDVVLSYTIKNNIYGALAARSLGIPFLPNVTGFGTAFLSGGVLQTLAHGLYRLAFAGLPVVFFQNEDDQALFIDRGLVEAGQARLLPGSGIDLAHFYPQPRPADHGGTVFLMIARLLRDKGVEEFVEAARLVRERHPAARFQLLGAVSAANRTAIDLPTVRGWVASHGIEYLGTSLDVRREIAAAHCVVLPSYREGAPRTLIEAAASGRPLIATDVPGCRSVVEDAATGLLCAPRSSESLAEACLRFLALSFVDQAAMGQAGRVKMEREFDEALVTSAYREALAPFRAVGEDRA